MLPGILFDKARHLKDCPTSRLVSRKSTIKSSAQSKYARDCYVLHQFLKCVSDFDLNELFSSCKGASTSEKFTQDSCLPIDDNTISTLCIDADMLKFELANVRKSSREIKECVNIKLIR